MMRVTSHNGRWGSPKHNGRNFDAERAGHIDAGRVSQNQYWVWDMEAEEMDPEAFERSELRYYNEQFGDALELQNARHRKHGDHKRVRTMEEVMAAPQRRPEESIWQIGDMNEDVDADTFMECVNEYMAFQMEWSEEHGNPFQFLNAAVHLDEASPHAHVRRVWQYKDAAGVWQVGQNNALEAAGVPLPDPTKPASKWNNRKMTYDAMCREKWLDICEAHGFAVEREADESHTTHIPKQEYIELQEREAALSKRETALDKREAEAQERLRGLQAKEAEAEARIKAAEAAERAAAQKMEEYKQELSKDVPAPSDAAVLVFAKRTRSKQTGKTLYEAMAEKLQQETEARRGHTLRSIEDIMADAQKRVREVDYGPSGRNRTRNDGFEL